MINTNRTFRVRIFGTIYICANKTIFVSVNKWLIQIELFVLEYLEPFKCVQIKQFLFVQTND